MVSRKIAVVIGVLFFAQMVTFMEGSALIESFLLRDASKATLILGVALEMVSGLAVATIGVLMYRVLKTVKASGAVGYPLLRFVEFAVSAVLAVYLLAQLKEFPNHLLWVYLPTAMGGVLLGYLLWVSRLVPRAIAGLGMIGYGMLLVGVPLDLAGVLDLNEGAGLVLLVPGGLFEFVFLPIWLIARGFRPASDRW